MRRGRLPGPGGGQGSTAWQARQPRRRRTVAGHAFTHCMPLGLGGILLLVFCACCRRCCRRCSHAAAGRCSCAGARFGAANWLLRARSTLRRCLQAAGERGFARAREDARVGNSQGSQRPHLRKQTAVLPERMVQCCAAMELVKEPPARHAQRAVTLAAAAAEGWLPQAASGYTLTEPAVSSGTDNNWPTGQAYSCTSSKPPPPYACACGCPYMVGGAGAGWVM